MTSTIGEPYRLFLEKADREGFEVMEGTAKLRAELEHSFADINDPNRRTKKLGWFDWMDMDIEELAAEKKKDKEKNVLDCGVLNYLVHRQRTHVRKVCNQTREQLASVINLGCYRLLTLV